MLQNVTPVDSGAVSCYHDRHNWPLRGMGQLIFLDCPEFRGDIRSSETRLRTPDLVEPGVSSLSTGQWYAHRRPGDSGKHFCPASAYVPLNERCCKMLRRLIRELFPAITTVTIGRCEEWVSLSSSTARSSGATSGVRRLDAAGTSACAT